MKKIEWMDLQVVPYLKAWDMQEELRKERIAGLIDNRLLMLEHPPVFTLGKQNCETDFHSTKETIALDGIGIVKTNRGGRITYHGPGQIVGYFICGLDSLRLGIKDFVHSIEEICINTLAEFDIKGSRDKDHPGLWIGTKKIAAIGLNVTHGVTQHGFALNVDCDLSAYRHIIACGIKDREVTSMEAISSQKIRIDKVKEMLIFHTGKVLQCEMIKL